MSDTLARIKPFLPSALVDVRALAGAQGLSEQLPSIASNFYFETRLGAMRSAIDFACCILSNAGRPSGSRRARELCRQAEVNSSWGGLAAFFTDWCKPQPVQDRLWPALWLGFEDVARQSVLDVPPCVSFAINAQIGRPGSTQHALRAARLVLDELARILGHPIDPEIISQTTKLFGRLPEGGRVMYASAMLPRPHRDIKLNVLVPRQSALGYLRRVGWPGAIDEVRRLVDRLGGASRAIRLDMTLGAQCERLGVELLSKDLDPSPIAATEFIGFLLDEGLCTTTKLQALQRWWGYSTERYPRHTWVSCLARNWYGKLCLTPDRNVEAKAYLGFSPQTFPLSLLINHAHSSFPTPRLSQ